MLVEKREVLHFGGGECEWSSLHWERVYPFLRTGTYDPATPPLKGLLKTNVCPHRIFTLLPAGTKWKPPKRPAADESINKTLFIHTMECYSHIKKNEVLMHAKTWMELENILSDRNQIKRPLI